MKNFSAEIKRLLSLLCYVLFVVNFCLSPITFAHNDSDTHKQNKQDVLYFGIVPQQSPTKLAELWNPFIHEVSKITGLHIHFETAPSIPVFEERLQQQRYDIAYMNPLHYAVYSETAGYKVIASQSDKQLKGILVVPKASELYKVSDLDNASIAFPAPLAFAATLIPQSVLKEQNLSFSTHYVNSHDSVYLNVSEGFFSAGGGVLRTFAGLEPEIRDNLRILWVSKGYMPHAFAVSPKISALEADKIQQALLRLSSSKLVRQLGFLGIDEASDEDYDEVRKLKETLNVNSAQ